MVYFSLPGRNTSELMVNKAHHKLKIIMELHRMLTFLGVVLLIATFAIYYGEDELAEGEFSFAYVTGIAMIAVFMGSFVLFNKDRWDKR